MLHALSPVFCVAKYFRIFTMENRYKNILVVCSPLVSVVCTGN